MFINVCFFIPFCRKFCNEMKMLLGDTKFKYDISFSFWIYLDPPLQVLPRDILKYSIKKINKSKSI